MSDAPPGQKRERSEPGQVDWGGRQVRGQGESGGLPPAGGPGGDRPDPDPVPVPGHRHLCVRPLAHRVHAPVYRERVYRGAFDGLRGRGAGVAALGGPAKNPPLGGGRHFSGPDSAGRTVFFPETVL